MDTDEGCTEEVVLPIFSKVVHSTKSMKLLYELLKNTYDNTPCTVHRKLSSVTQVEDKKSIFSLHDSEYKLGMFCVPDNMFEYIPAKYERTDPNVEMYVKHLEELLEIEVPQRITISTLTSSHECLQALLIVFATYVKVMPSAFDISLRAKTFTVESQPALLTRLLELKSEDEASALARRTIAFFKKTMHAHIVLLHTTVHDYTYSTDVYLKTIDPAFAIICKRMNGDLIFCLNSILFLWQLSSYSHRNPYIHSFMETLRSVIKEKQVSCETENVYNLLKKKFFENEECLGCFDFETNDELTYKQSSTIHDVSQSFVQILFEEFETWQPSKLYGCMDFFQVAIKSGFLKIGSKDLIVSMINKGLPSSWVATCEDDELLYVNSKLNIQTTNKPPPFTQWDEQLGWYMKVMLDKHHGDDTNTSAFQLYDTLLSEENKPYVLGNEMLCLLLKEKLKKFRKHTSDKSWCANHLKTLDCFRF